MTVMAISFLLIALIIILLWIIIANAHKDHFAWFPVLKATNYFIHGKHSDAIDFLITRLKRHHGNIDTLWLLGNLYREKGWTDRAIKCHQELLNHKNLSDDIKRETLLSLALDYHRAGMLQRASSTFQELIQLDNGFPEAYAAYEKLLEELRDWQKAIEVQKNIVQQDNSPRQLTTLSFLHNELGEELMSSKRYLDAIAQFRESIFADKQTFYAYINMGKAYYQLNELEQTITVWEQLLEENSSYAYLVFNDLFHLYEQLGLTYKKQALIEKIKSHFWKNWKALEFLVDISAKEAHYDEAIHYLMQALEINPYLPTLQYHLVNFFRSPEIPAAIKDQLSNYFESIKDKFIGSDPHVCIICQYISDEYLKRCPHCQQWNTLISR